ncbi:MAG: HlyD family efflux transporter periplasmic adaptor subunit [Syntrophomonas sp.]
MSLRQDREISRQRFKNILRWQIIIGGLFLLIFVLYNLYSYTVYSISKKNVEVVIGRYGSIGDEVAVKMVVLNEETTYYAPTEGHFENMVRENDKVRKNDLVGYFITASQQKQSMLAANAGMFTLQTDGLEKVFRSVNFATVTPEVFQYKQITGLQLRGHCFTGDPIYKIVNNLKPTHLLIHFPEKNLKTTIKPGQQINVVYKGLKLNNATVKQEKRISKEIILLVELTDFCSELIGQRYIDGKCIYNLQKGYLIPQKAIVTKDSANGIYCLKGQDIYFKVIKILKKQNEMAVVDGLEANDMVIAHPGFFLRYLK